VFSSAPPRSITTPTRTRAISIARRLRLDSRQAATVTIPKLIQRIWPAKTIVSMTNSASSLGGTEPS
jgi:hypothetical protein